MTSEKIENGNLTVYASGDTAATLTLKPGQVACVFDLRPDGNPGLYTKSVVNDDGSETATSIIVSSSQGARTFKAIGEGIRLNLTAFRKIGDKASKSGPRVLKRGFDAAGTPTATLAPKGMPRR